MFRLLAIAIVLIPTLLAAQRRLITPIAFMAIDSGRTSFAVVENKYPESAIYLNATNEGHMQWSFTIGKDWTAKQESSTFRDTTIERHRLSDTAYFCDINNDGLQDVVIGLQAQHGWGPAGGLARWIAFVQARGGEFGMIKVVQYGSPFYRVSRKNYWKSSRLEEDTIKRTKYWVTDLFELKGSQFVNVGANRGFPRIEEYGGKLPKLTKRLRQSLRHEAPGMPAGWQPPEIR